MLIFLPRIYIVLIFSSLISDHTVLPNLLQCDPPPRTSDSSSSCAGGLWGRGYTYSLSCDSTQSPHGISVHPLTLQLMFPMVYMLCSRSHMKELWHVHGSWNPGREHWYPVIGTGGDVSSSILVRCQSHLPYENPPVLTGWLSFHKMLKDLK